MSEFIDHEKAIANIKAAYCCGCENYNGVRCRARQIFSRFGCPCLNCQVNVPKSFTGVKKQVRQFAPFAGMNAAMIIILTNFVQDVEHAFGLTRRKPNMTNPTCKDCPDRHPICHDSCQRYAEYKRQLKAQRIYTSAHHAAERISRNDFDKEGWMGGRKR